MFHVDVIQWKNFPRYWPLCGEWPVNSPHKGQWSGAWMLSLICAWINSWVNNREAGDLTRLHAHYDIIVMLTWHEKFSKSTLFWSGPFNSLLYLHVVTKLCSNFNGGVANFSQWNILPTLIARFMGPTWDPAGADRAQVGPMLAPWTLLSGECMTSWSYIYAKW